MYTLSAALSRNTELDSFFVSVGLQVRRGVGVELHNVHNGIYWWLVAPRRKEVTLHRFARVMGHALLPQSTHRLHTLIKVLFTPTKALELTSNLGQ